MSYLHNSIACKLNQLHRAQYKLIRGPQPPSNKLFINDAFTESPVHINPTMVSGWVKR